MFSFLEFIQVLAIESFTVMSAYILTYTDHKKIGSQICEIVTKCNPQNIGVNALYKYSKIKTKWTKFWNTSYNNYYLVKASVDIIYFSGRYLYSKLTNIRYEPFYEQWMSTCVLSRDLSKISVLISDNNERYVNFGYIFKEKYIRNGGSIENAQHLFAMECSIQANYADIPDLEILMLMKNDKLYLSRIIYLLSRENYSLDLQILWSPSTVRFLSVEYNHPLLKKPIPIDIDKGFYLEGNLLFSAAFVKRCLEYHNKDIVIDMNYTLKIMDSNINMFEICAGEYIVLDKDSYKIIAV